MNPLRLLVAAIVSLGAVHAQSNVIAHDKVQPIAQPDPVTVAEKAAVKFKPQLKITGVCHPYPAVEADGSVSGGLKWSGKKDGDCEGSSLGSQVYSRSTWVGDVWAIMYAWYFPKGRPVLPSPIALRLFGLRHNWEYAIVWIDNPDVKNATMLGLSMSASLGYSKQAPPKSDYVDGSSVKLDYYYNLLMGTTALRSTEDAGEFQDLVQWNQLPGEAREALISTDWDTSPLGVAHVEMPLKDGVFMKRLTKAYPF